jgi:hypothetical protein
MEIRYNNSMEDEHNQEIIAAITNNILMTLRSQPFKDWYVTRFEAYVVGDLEDRFNTESHLVAETLIKRDIQKMFNLV